MPIKTWFRVFHSLFLRAHPKSRTCRGRRPVSRCIGLATVGLFGWALSFLPLTCFCDERISVRNLLLPLGEEVVIAVPEPPIVNAFSSSDRIARIKMEIDRVVVKSMEFGVATVTIFYGKGGNKIRLARISVVPQPAELPKHHLESLRRLGPLGPHGRVGSRLGFRSQRGLFENLILQEEYFAFDSGPGNLRQSVDLKTSRPLLYGEPKPDRYVDNIGLQYDKKEIFLLRLGDNDPLLQGMGNSGPLRGLRLDLPWRKAHSYAFGGFAHPGVEHFLFGKARSTVGGAGFSYPLSEAITVRGHSIGFEKNPTLELRSGGVENQVGVSVRWKNLELLDLNLMSDAHFRGFFDAVMTWNFSPLSLSMGAGRGASDLNVFTLPNRFGPAVDTYSLLGSIGPENRIFRLGAGLSKSLSFSTQEQFPGISEVQSKSVSLDLNPHRNLNVQFHGNEYHSKFSPYVAGTASDETGHRLEARTELSIADTQQVTLGGEFSEIDAKQLDLSYENQQAAFGWKKLFSGETRDHFHLEAGLSHFYYPTSPPQSGSYSLARAGSRIDFSWLELEGLLQHEMKLSQPSRNNVRAQLASLWIPHPRHELRLALFNNFEWFRNIYSDSRGLFIAYTLHFGDVGNRQSLFDRLQRYEITGRVYLDEDGNGMWGGKDIPYRAIVVRLKDSGENERTDHTDEQGSFRFSGLKKGIYFLRVDRNGIPSTSRLTTASPKSVELTDGNAAFDFVFSQASELSGTVFNDLFVDGNLDEQDPPIEGVRILYRGLGRSLFDSVTADTGSYLISNLTPGKYELTIDPQSLRAGFRLDVIPKYIIEVPQSSFVKQDIGLQAERTISGVVFLDRNGNGIQDKNETGIDNRIVKFLTYRTHSGDGGRFIFRHLPPGKGRARCRGSESEIVVLNAQPTTVIHVMIPVKP